MRDLLEAQRTDPARFTEFTRYVQLYRPAYVAGHLLEDGGVSAQPHRYIEYVLALGESETKSETKYLELTKKEGA